MNSIPQRADTTKGPPLRILSLDGGGVRGYSMLILLQELMHRTYVEIHGTAPTRGEIPKPCDHFDLIVGTGTGGLIAIMLGRLRLDLETCKEVYVRMTRRVFETDKTFAGMPLRSTLFKASKLEEAIRDCVRQHTISDDEGNDSLANAQSLLSPMTPETPVSALSTQSSLPQRSLSTASRQSIVSLTGQRGPLGEGRWGNPNTLLYDVRKDRTKTAVTAVYKGSPKDAPAALLRSYDSRKEPAPETNCMIWQAGRATSATGIAFKPIQIGQSIFIDEGNGKFNPSPQVLDEAAINEWPGREVGVFVSIGTGKRPRGTDHEQAKWYESFIGGEMGEFAKAKRKLMAKIEGCEDTHQHMLHEHLSKRQVNASNYFRLNVEVGVGEFGMNEWNRLTDISINTRMYLGRQEVQNINLNASAKLARIHRAKLRYERATAGNYESTRNSWQESIHNYEPPPPSNPMAVELPAGSAVLDPQSISQHVSSPLHSQPHSLPPYQPPPRYNYHKASDADKYPIPAASEPRVSTEGHSQPHEHNNPRMPFRPSYEGAPYPNGHPVSSPRVSEDSQGQGGHAPPLPPKTPIGVRQPGTLSRPPVGIMLPYPDTDGPPPPVNMAKKPAG